MNDVIGIGSVSCIEEVAPSLDAIVSHGVLVVSLQGLVELYNFFSAIIVDENIYSVLSIGFEIEVSVKVDDDRGSRVQLVSCTCFKSVVGLSS